MGGVAWQFARYPYFWLTRPSNAKVHRAGNSLRCVALSAAMGSGLQQRLAVVADLPTSQVVDRAARARHGGRHMDGGEQLACSLWQLPSRCGA